jgi:hypothetical protein
MTGLWFMGSILPELPSHGVGHHFGTKRLDIVAMAVLKLDQAWLAGMVLDLKGCPSQEVEKHWWDLRT